MMRILRRRKKKKKERKKEKKKKAPDTLACNGMVMHKIKSRNGREWACHKEASEQVRHKQQQ